MQSKAHPLGYVRWRSPDGRQQLAWPRLTHAQRPPRLAPICSRTQAPGPAADDTLVPPGLAAIRAVGLRAGERL
jgi:hypothetical protein